MDLDPVRAHAVDIVNRFLGEFPGLGVDQQQHEILVGIAISRINALQRRTASIQRSKRQAAAGQIVTLLLQDMEEIRIIHLLTDEERARLEKTVEAFLAGYEETIK